MVLVWVGEQRSEGERSEDFGAGLRFLDHVPKLNNSRRWGETERDFSLGSNRVKNLRRERGARSVETHHAFSPGGQTIQEKGGCAGEEKLVRGFKEVFDKLTFGDLFPGDGVLGRNLTRLVLIHRVSEAGEPPVGLDFRTLGREAANRTVENSGERCRWGGSGSTVNPEGGAAEIKHKFSLFNRGAVRKGG